MAKREKVFRETVPAPLPKVELNSRWRSMTNWFIVLSLVLPVLYSRSTIDPNITPRYICISIFVLVYLGFFFLLKRLKYSSLPLLIKAVFILSIAFSVWSVLSMFSAINVSTALYEVLRCLLNVVLLFLVMLTVQQEESQVVKLCNALMIVSLIQSLVGVMQFYELAFTDLPGGNPKPYGLMANRNLFGSAQALLLPFVFYVFYKAGRGWKYLSVLACVGIAMSVVISQTRSALLATIVEVMISAILILIFLSKRRRKLMYAGIAVLSVTLIISITLISVNKESFLYQSLKMKAEDILPHTANENSSASWRLAQWDKTLKVIKDYPVLGVGPGNWKLAIPFYGSDVAQWSNGLLVPSRPHNVYLSVASETGIPGAILYFTSWMLIAMAAIKVIQKSRLEGIRVLMILMLAGLAAFATDSMFSFPTERIEHSLYLIFMAGIILGVYANISTAVAVKKMANKWLISFAALITLFNLFLGYKKYNFEAHAQLAKTYRMEKQPLEAINEVEAGKSNFVTLDPEGEPLEMQSGAAYVELNDYQKALQEIKVAKIYHPHSARVLTTMGVIYANLKQWDKAAECYVQALKLTPRYGVALKNLAGVYYSLGKYSLCVETLNKLDIQNDKYSSDLLIRAQEHVNK